MKRYEYGFLITDAIDESNTFIEAKNRRKSQYKDTIEAFAQLGNGGWLRLSHEDDERTRTTTYTFVREAE